MNVVWQHIIAAVLAITNFSIKANPKAPDGDAVLAYAVDDADIVVHVDWQPTVIDNYATFSKLPDDPLIKQAPELRQQIQEMLLQAEGGRATAKAMIGFDPMADLTSFSAFAKLKGGGGPPDFLVVVRGNFAADLPSKLAKTAGGKDTPIDGHSAATMPDGTMIGIAKGGALLVGKSDWVSPRLKNDWKPSARPKTSVWGRIEGALDAKPFFLFASKPSADAIAMMSNMAPNFGKDVLAGHDLMVFTASSTGIGWMFQAKDAALAKRIKMASEGLIDLLRASHLAPRGMLQIAAAALPSYAKMSPEIDAVLASKDKLMTAVWDLTGDGKFEAKVKLDGNLVTVTTKGKKLSDVVPASALVGFGAIGFVTARKSEAAAPPPPARATPVKPRSGGAMKPPVTPGHK